MAEIEILAFHRDTAADLDRLLVVALHRGGETGRHGLERDAAFRTLRAGHRRHDGREIKLQRVGEHRIGRRLGVEQARGLAVLFDQRDARRLAAGRLEIIERLGIDREEAAGRAVFRCHVGDGGAVGQRQRIEAGP